MNWGSLILEGLTIVVVVYFGWHLRQQLKTLQATVATQEKTIAAQEQHMKAQSAVLQDFERLNTAMKHVIDTVSDPAALQREQAYKARVERDAEAQLKRLQATFEATLKQSTWQTQELTTQAFLQDISGLWKLIYHLLPLAEPERRQTLIEAAGLPVYIKEQLQELARGMPHFSTSDLWEQYLRNPLFGLLTDTSSPQNSPGELPR